jgi:hypothetical protein
VRLVQLSHPITASAVHGEGMGRAVSRVVGGYLTEPVWCSRVWYGGVVLGAGGRARQCSDEAEGTALGRPWATDDSTAGWQGGRAVESAKAGRGRGGSAGCIRKRLPSSSPAKHARVGR